MYKNLIAAMAVEKITQEMMATLLGVHRNTIANRLNGEGNFSINEAFKIKSQFFPNYEIEKLFAKEKKEEGA